MISDILFSELGKVLDVLVDAVVVHVIGGRLGSQYPFVANVLLGEAMPVMTADHRIGQVEIFDHRLQLALVLFGHLAAEDHGDLLGLTDGSIQVQQPFGEFIHRGAAMEDEVVAILHLREEEAMLTTSMLPFLVGDERSERGQPLLAALQQVLSGEGVGEFL